MMVMMAASPNTSNQTKTVSSPTADTMMTTKKKKVKISSG